MKSQKKQSSIRTNRISRIAVLTRGNKATHAGGKAPADVQEICERAGFDCISLPSVPTRRFSSENLRRFVIGVAKLVSLRISGLPDILIVQHPIVGKLEKRIIEMLFGRCKRIALIHDLDVIRKPTDHAFDDLVFLKKFDVLVAHTDAMKALIVKEAPQSTVLVLGVFDYLVDEGTFRTLPCAGRPTGLLVIGNLHPMKASYLYGLTELQTSIAIYGPNCEVNRLPPKIEWKGVVGLNGLPGEKIDSFGLVWDGESPDRLEGLWGEYLRYNAPHKLSLYVVLGMPVIVHSESGMVDFVKSRGIGFSADTVAAAADRAKGCSEDEWRGYCEAVRRLRTELVEGRHTLRALDLAIKAVTSTKACRRSVLQQGNAET